ncbi:MAG: hypothetical protein ACQGVC_25340, partial [Myxococcota bacterium]
EDRLPLAHRYLTRNAREECQTAPLWLLDSDWREVAAAIRARERGEQDPRIDYHLGALALVERDPEGAALAFRRAAAGGPLRRAAQYLEVYALALAGRRDEAAARAEANRLRDHESEQDARYDRFVRSVLRGR